MAQPGRPLFDAGNARIAVDISADLDIGKVDIPGSEMGFATIRMGNATMSVPLDHAGAKTWGNMFLQLADLLAPSGKLVVPSRTPILPAAPGQRA
jgi:hypothetical protein